MINGTVKFYNRAKGFGFITPLDGKEDAFVTASALAASGVATLTAGQRVSFESMPDKKGPKVTNVRVEAEAPREAPAPKRQAGVTIYYDSSSREAEEVIAAARAASGEEPRLVDYKTTPPDRDELKRLSLWLRDNDQSLVRRYDHLFMELRLDDRFIGESEFWTAIIEHPQLINGPVLARGHSARLCKNREDVRAFLGGGEQAKPAKTISPRIMAMMAGRPVEPKPANEDRIAEPANDIGEKTIANPKTAPAKIKKAVPVKKTVTIAPAKKPKAKPKAVAPKPKKKK